MKLLLLTPLLLLACGPKTPLTVLPTAEQVRIQQLEADNKNLRESLTNLERNCSAVLSLYKSSRDYSNSPASKEK